MRGHRRHRPARRGAAVRRRGDRWQRRLSLGETLLLAYAGGVLGDLSSYWIGRRFHQNIRRLPGLRSHPQWITAAEVYFERYGIASLLVGRFIGALRPMLPMVAGMLDMPFGRFSAFR